MTSLKALVIWFFTSVHAPTGVVPCANIEGSTDGQVTVPDEGDTGAGPRGSETPASRARTGTDDGIYNGF